MKQRYRLASALAILVLAALFALNRQWPWRRFEVALLPQQTALPVAAVRDTLRSGETLEHIFGRHGLAGQELTGLFARAGLDLRRLRAGLVVDFRRQPEDSMPSEIRLRTGPDERLAARLAPEGWSAERQSIAWHSEVIRLEGPIDNSLYSALDAQIPDDLLDAANRVRLAWDLADVYAWSVDFNRDIQPGDRFAVLVERQISEEGEIKSGAILAADLFTAGRHLTAFRFVSEGRAAFYDEQGNSLRRAFLRAPVEFRRIASGFSRSRYHPILGIWRRHEGTDYSAARGTPVLAAGDGVVIRAGWGGGYGNLVELRHLNGITTRYGHLSRFGRGIRPGVRVRQGDVVGLVGSSGLASGPHLHYEFRINGVARDSRRVELGRGAPLPSGFRALFAEQRVRLSAELAGTPSPARIAE